MPTKPEKLAAIVEAIPEWSRRLQENGRAYKRKLDSARNFVTDEAMDDWTFGKSVGALGDYHRDGGGARGRIERLGFIDALEQPEGSFRRAAIESFRAWAANVRGSDLNGKLDRKLAGTLNSEFRLLLPPEVVEPGWVPPSRRRAAQNAEEFDEGFRHQVTLELGARNRDLVVQGRLVHGLICAACGFNFEGAYGAHGAGYIEMHHLKPIAEGARRSRVEDLRPVCANCHRMLHRGDTILSIEELSRIVEAERGARR